MEQLPSENNPDLSLVNSHYPTLPSDWEYYHDVIQDLYVTKHMALPDVIEEMKRDYKFVATERQYKRRISDWHLDKNVKDKEMRTIIAVDAMRLRQGKKSTFHVRGRLVDRKKIDRFVQRKRIDRSALESLPGMQHLTSTSHYSSSDCMSLLPENVRCSTPPDDRPPIIYVSEDPGRGTSNRGLIHGNISGTRGAKRVRDLGIRIGDVDVSLDAGHDHEHQKDSSPTRKRTRNSHDTLLHAPAKGGLNRSIWFGESGQDDDILVTGTSITTSGVAAQRPLTHSKNTMASTISRSDSNPQGAFRQCNEAFGTLSMISTSQTQSVPATSAHKILPHSTSRSSSFEDTFDGIHVIKGYRTSNWQQNETEQLELAQQNSVEPLWYQQQIVNPFLAIDQCEPTPPDIDREITNAVDGTMLPRPHSQTCVAGRKCSEHSVSPSMIEYVKKFMDDFSWAGIASLYEFLIRYREQHDQVNKQSGNSAAKQHNTLPNMPILTADTARPSMGSCPIPSQSNSGLPEIPTHLATYQSASRSSISEESSISTEIDSRERHRKSLVGFHTPPTIGPLGMPATKNPLHKLDLDSPSPYSLATFQRDFSAIETSLAGGTAPSHAVLNDTQTSLDIASQPRALPDASQIRLNYFSTQPDHLRGSLNNVSEEEQRGPPKLTINDLLRAAQYVQPPDSPDATTLDRTLTDIDQNELYIPSINTLAPPEQSRQGHPKEGPLPPSKNSVFSDLLQAAQIGHLTARSAPPSKSKAHPQSPFKSGSPLATSAAELRVELRKQQKAE